MRQIGKELGRSRKFVKKWMERDNNENLPRGRSQYKTVRSEEFDEKVKRKMVGALRAEGGGKRRKLSISETVAELKEEGIECCYSTVQQSVKEIAIYRRRRKRVALTEGYASRRFEFADSHLSWSTTEWGKVLNTDFSPFYLKFSYNRQNDGFWLGEGDDPMAQ